MSVRIVIPVQAPERGKSRLVSALSADERVALNRRFFEDVLRTATAVAPGQCYVVSRSSDILTRAEAMGAHAIAEWGACLNAALAQAAAEIGGDEPVLSLSTDLPWLRREDLEAMIAAGQAHPVVAAADTTASGTNALLLSRPGLIPYRYGPGSLAAHKAEAERRGLSFLALTSNGLSRDIDTPEDLEGSGGCGLGTSEIDAGGGFTVNASGNAPPQGQLSAHPHSIRSSSCPRQWFNDA